MTALFKSLWNDNHGFIVSAELILVATIGVIAMVVGLSEISLNVSHELDDVGAAYGAVNQSFVALGLCGHGGAYGGSRFIDHKDFCDREGDIVTKAPLPGESKLGHDHD